MGGNSQHFFASNVFFVSCFLGPVTLRKEKLLKHGVAGMPAGAKDLWPHLQAPWLVGEG